MKGFGLFLGLFFFLCACRKEKTVNAPCSCANNECATTAMIRDEGTGVDGCGWHVIAFMCTTPSGPVYLVDYIPKNLSSAFQIDSLAVTVTFSLEGDSAICGFSGIKFPLLNIIDIKKQ